MYFSSSQELLSFLREWYDMSNYCWGFVENCDCFEESVDFVNRIDGLPGPNVLKSILTGVAPFTIWSRVMESKIKIYTSSNGEEYHCLPERAGNNHPLNKRDSIPHFWELSLFAFYIVISGITSRKYILNNVKIYHKACWFISHKKISGEDLIVGKRCREG